MNSAAFGMLTPLPLAPKPRTTSLMLMSEVGIPLRQTEDLLEIAAIIIDYAIASVSPYDVVAVDAIRRGLHRKAEFRYIFGKRAPA